MQDIDFKTPQNNQQWQNLSEFLQSDEGKKIELIKDENGRSKYRPKNAQLKILAKFDELNLADVDTSKITNMKYLFKGSTRKDFSGIETWDVSNVVGFEGIFYGLKEFNADITSWKVHNARTFQDMFYQCYAFNQAIGAFWDTSSATNMIGMFRMAKSFNNNAQPFGEKWRMDKVGWAWEMFWGAESFNQAINHWNMQNVIKCFSMFRGAKSFNQPLNLWNLSKVQRLEQMFNGAESFNQDLSSWGEWIGNATNLSKMFAKTKSLNINFLSSWKISGNCNTDKWIKGSGLESKAVQKRVVELNKKFVVGKIDIKGDLMKHLQTLQIIKKALAKYNDNAKFLGNFLPTHIQEQYKIYLAKYDENDEFLITSDEKEWDFAFFELFEHYFLIEKDNDIEDLKITDESTIYQGRNEKDFGEDFDIGEKGTIYEGDALKIYFEPREIFIVNKQITDNSAVVLSIVNIFTLAKAYNVQMRELDKIARAYSKTKDLQKCYEHICEFDLHSYRNIPITQNSRDERFLVDVWQQISDIYMVQQTHDELKEAISQIAKLVSDKKSKNITRTISLVAILVSLFVGIFAPFIREFLLRVFG